MTVKTQPDDADKIPVIQKLIADNVDIETILASLEPAGRRPA
jgi:hypothetical protein